MKLFEIELPVTALKTALAGLNKVIGKSTLPVLRCVCLVRDEKGQVTISATDLDSVVTYRIPGQFEGPVGTVLIPAEAFAKAVKANKQKIGLVLEPNDQLIIRSFVSSVAFEEPVETVPMEEWPVLPRVNGSWNDAGEAFKNAFVEAQACASSDAARFVLNGVCLDLTQDGHYVVATDGRHLYSANSFHFDLKHSIIVPSRRFLAWSGFIDDGAWSFRVQPAENPTDGGWIEFQSEHWTFATKLIAGEYPNWKQVVPRSDSPLTTIVLSSEGLEQLLEAAPRLPVSDRTNCSVTLSAANQKLVLKSRPGPELPWNDFAVAGASIEGADQSIALNRDLLLKALRMQLVTLEVRDPLTPVVFRAEGKCLVVAPLRVEVDQPANAPAAPEESAGDQQTDEPAINGEASTPSEAPLQPRTEIERNTVVDTNTRTATRGSTTSPLSNGTNPSELKEHPLKQTATRLESLRQGLKDLMNDVNLALSHVKVAERDQKNSEKEIESVRSTLRSLQKVQI